MLPRPITPSVLRRSSVPRKRFPSHLPRRVESMACGIWRAMASIRPRVCSATATAFSPGMFITSTPAEVAASRSTKSAPTPGNAMTAVFSLFSICAAVTLAAREASRASASARWFGIRRGWRRRSPNRAGLSERRFPLRARLPRLQFSWLRLNRHWLLPADFLLRRNAAGRRPRPNLISLEHRWRPGSTPIRLPGRTDRRHRNSPDERCGRAGPSFRLGRRRRWSRIFGGILLTMTVELSPAGL